MGITAAVITAVAATASVGVGIAGYEAGQSASRAQHDLEASQAAALKKQQDDAAAQAASQATTGSSFGFSDESHRTLLTGFGFGTAPAGSPNSGRGQITGLG